MSLKSLLVAFNGSEASVSALEAAAAIAKRQDAYVTALLAHAVFESYAPESRFMSPATREVIARAGQEIIDAIEARFQEVAGNLDLGQRLSFERARGPVDRVLAAAARHHDLLAVGRIDPGATDPHVLLNPDRLALMSGRPLLLVPPGHDVSGNHGHAVLAWDGGRAAARALSDAMDLLSDEGRVTVLTVGDKPTPRPVAELELYLARHEIAAGHVHLPAPDGIAAAILEFCEEADPSLLAMGAYEHSKFREDFFGGVTVDVMAQANVPVLLSH